MMGVGKGFPAFFFKGVSQRCALTATNFWLKPQKYAKALHVKTNLFRICLKYIPNFSDGTCGKRIQRKERTRCAQAALLLIFEFMSFIMSFVGTGRKINAGAGSWAVS